MTRWTRPAFAAVALAGVGCMAFAGTPASAPPTVRNQEAMSGSEAIGRTLVRVHCAGCHAIERTDESPLRGAPPLRDLGVAYRASDLQEAFAEGIITGHPAMPEFQFTPQEIADLTAYLSSISGPPSNSPPSKGF